MKLSDYVAEFLAKKGVKHVFGITGGFILHIFDSIGRRDDIEMICPNHEQAASMAADAYSRMTETIGVAMSTSGPGAANLINGVMCSHFDSIPLLVITGQCPTGDLINKEDGCRQIGFQQMDTADIYKPFTKYAKLILNPNDIQYELEKAMYIAKNGRYGAVILDLPDDVQRAEIEPHLLRKFIPPSKSMNYIDYHTIRKISGYIQVSKNPLFILGSGIRISNFSNHGTGLDKIKKIINQLGIPYALTWGALDIFPFDHKLNLGGFGVIGSKFGNKAIQEADLIICVGSRLDGHATTNKFSLFGRSAIKKIIVDIENDELQKMDRRGIKNALYINASATEFFDVLDTMNPSKKPYNDWIEKLNEWKNKYPICLDSYRDEKGFVNPYVFLDELSKVSSDKDIIITDSGANLAYTMQGYRVKGSQRVISDLNHSSMGYSLPASIGACFANNKKRIICVIGDGGIQMNIQELATIKKHNLPIKVFIFNNKGYGMIMQTQDDWLDSRYIGSCNDEGLAIPDTIKIARAYGLKTEVINNHSELYKIKEVLESDESIVCDVNISINQRITPKLMFGKELDEI